MQLRPVIVGMRRNEPAGPLLVGSDNSDHIHSDVSTLGGDRADGLPCRNHLELNDLGLMGRSARLPLRSPPNFLTRGPT